MIEWSLDAFRVCERVRSIVVAAPPGHDRGLGGVGVGGGLGRSGLTVVDGGATRAESVSNALAAVETDLVAIHDAARPLVTPELIEALVANLDASPGAAAVIAATAVTDTVKQASADTRAAFASDSEGNAARIVERTLDRSMLWAAQTPQVFRVEVLRPALDVEGEVRDAATDEAMLVEAAGGTVLIHPALGENLKVTTPLDLRLAEFILTERAGSASQ